MRNVVAVVDASVWVDALLPGSRRAAARSLLDEYTFLAGPEHFRLEIANALRRYVRDSAYAQVDADKVIRVIREITIDTVPTASLLTRIWELRDELTAYDAAYLAAAEYFGGHLVTRDSALVAHADRAQCVIRELT